MCPSRPNNNVYLLIYNPLVNGRAPETIPLAASIWKFPCSSLRASIPVGNFYFVLFISRHLTYQGVDARLTLESTFLCLLADTLSYCGSHSSILPQRTCVSCIYAFLLLSCPAYLLSVLRLRVLLVSLWGTQLAKARRAPHLLPPIPLFEF